MTRRAVPSGASDEWLALYRSARDRSDRAGYYNRNTFSEIHGHSVVVRIPIPGAPGMDLRVLPETVVLRAARDAHLPVPEVLHESEAPIFAVHEYIDGQVLDTVAPSGTALPEQAIPDLVDTITRLHRVPIKSLPRRPDWWPRDGDSAAFAAVLLRHTQSIFTNARATFAKTYRALGVPEDPLARVWPRLERLRSRPFRLVHADLHRKNLILDGRHTWVLDWELALWGDPLYEIAVHLHKMRYLPDEQQAFLALLARSPAGPCLEDADEDLETLLMHERCKSVLVDSLRYAEELQREGMSSGPRTTALCTRLAAKLADAASIWDAPPAAAREVRRALAGG